MDYITTSNLYWNRFELEVIKQMPFTDKDLERCVVTKGDLLVCEGGDIGRAAIWNYDYDICIQNHIHRLRGKLQLCNLFYYYVFYEYKLINCISSKGTTIQGLSSKEIDTLLIPLPPLAEQKRIVAEIEKWFALIDELDANKQDLQSAVKQVRAKVLDLAIHGKLVSQDPNDESAIDLLRRINPHYTPSDTSHYQNIPFDIPTSWQWVQLGIVFQLINGDRGNNYPSKEKLQELRDKLDEYSKKKLNLERESLKPDEDISEESLEKDDYDLSDQSNKFLEELSSLPSFKDRDRKDGYSIDTSKYSSIPDSLVRTLISKFLNQRFCKRDTDLNIRSNSFSKTHGFHKWEVKDMILHLETEQLNKVLEDKYGYQYANGASENVPLSFYFDMSGSMSEYTNMLAVIAIELLKKNVKVLIGFNERVNVQIDKIDKNITIDELVSVLESAGYSGYSYNNSDRFIRNSKVTYKFINRDIDDYLFSKECEKCVVFSDFDPLSEVIGLSQKAKVYWFCFENYFNKYDLGRFKGFIYQTNSAEDIINGLIKVNENRFETLCFVSNNKTLQRRK